MGLLVPQFTLLSILLKQTLRAHNTGVWRKENITDIQIVELIVTENDEKKVAPQATMKDGVACHLLPYLHFYLHASWDFRLKASVGGLHTFKKYKM